MTTPLVPWGTVADIYVCLFIYYVLYVDSLKTTETYVTVNMKPARGPQTLFFGNYCSEIPGLANYEMPSEVCEGNFCGPF